MFVISTNVNKNEIKALELLLKLTYFTFFEGCAHVKKLFKISFALQREKSKTQKLDSNDKSNAANEKCLWVFFELQRKTV